MPKRDPATFGKAWDPSVKKKTDEDVIFCATSWMAVPGLRAAARREAQRRGLVLPRGFELTLEKED